MGILELLFFFNLLFYFEFEFGIFGRKNSLFVFLFEKFGDEFKENIWEWFLLKFTFFSNNSNVFLSSILLEFLFNNFFFEKFGEWILDKLILFKEFAEDEFKIFFLLSFIEKINYIF